MALLIKQVNASTTPVALGATAIVLAQVPPGPSTVVVSNMCGVTIYLGGSGVSATNGFPITSGAPPVTVPGFGGTVGTPLYVIAPTGSVTGGVGVIVSTASGGTGP